MKLTVAVNEELTLDAGSVTYVDQGSGPCRVITPPATSLFAQLVAYLDTKPFPRDARRVPLAGQEGVAAAALCVRWGSYFAVLADQTKPHWPVTRTPEQLAQASRISDSEMKRINIEASAAMATLVALFRSDPFGRYAELVHKARIWLPMPQKTVSAPRESVLYGLASPEVRGKLAQTLSLEQLADAQTRLRGHADRVFSNALVNHGWRNGPIEDIHAGVGEGLLPLDQSRITPTEVRDLMRYSAANFQAGLNVCLALNHERPMATWLDQVLPFDQVRLVRPSGWSLTDASCEINEPATAQPANR